MTLERWRKIEEIFQAALDLEGEERARFVDRECAGDAELRAEVEKFIARFETEDSFLESPVWTDSRMLESDFKHDFAHSLEEMAPAVDAFDGRRVGVYRLTEELGRGGMGVVYLAERADGEFQQKVAIKLIKRGMDTDFILRRFRQERQIAATLNHPNIARLLDGGTTADDLPYFVMEYIDGLPFFKYAAAHQLDLRAKLELFLEVCAAIAYAHKKRIIHRDIKPGNILVTEDGEPKLLDFGIAKILDPDLIHETAMPTATQMRLMTPEYASPEQVRGDEITPASDQYSLGVLLYELLTGSRPYKFPSRAPHEIARIICEEIPSEPSSGAFGQTLGGAGEAASFDADFCQKLDRLVLKALRKKPTERYASVKDLIADIERFLRNEPVLAEAPVSASISLHASAAPDSGAVSGGVNQKSIAVLPFKILDAVPGAETGDGLFLGIGLADALITRLSNVRRFVVRPTSSVMRFSENDHQADSFAAGRELNVAYVLDGHILKSSSRIRVSVQLLDVAADSTVWAERFDEDFSDVLTLEDKISTKVAELLVPHLTAGEREKLEKRGTDEPKAYEAYLRGRFYRNMFTEESFGKAFDAFREAISYDPSYALAYAGIADYYLWLGVYGLMPPKECHPLAKAAAERAIELDDSLAEAYASLGFAQISGDYDWAGAEKNAVRAVELNPNYAVARLWYSYILQTAGRFDEALVQARRAVELDPLTYTNHHVLALNLYMSRRYDEALAQAALNVKNFSGIGMAYHTQSWFLRYLGRYRESLEALERARELAGDSLFLLFGRAQALAAAGRRAEAEEFLEEIFRQGEHQYLSYYQVALVYAYARDNERALAALERAFADREGWLIWLKVEPALDHLRKEPQFIALRRQIDGYESISSTAETSLQSRKTLENQKSIAVLPFRMMSTGASGEGVTADFEFLGFGLADALITRLSNVRQLLVRPTSSVFKFSDLQTDSLTAGRELGVGFVLEGTIIKSERRIRVSVQLLDVGERKTIWAARLDEDLTDVLSLEDTISAQVAESLVPQLTTGERLVLEKRGTADPAAYEAYLRGRYYWNTFTEEGFRQALTFYQKAIEIDPGYALAHAALADYYVWLGVYGSAPSEEYYPAARGAALRAVELDPDLAEAYAALGLARLYGEYDWRQSENDLLRAGELNPNSSIVHLWHSHILYIEGRFEEGTNEVRRAVELDPLSFLNHNTLAWSFYFSRRFEEALRKIDDVIERFPAINQAYSSKAFFLNCVGRSKEALETAEYALKLSGNSIFTKYAVSQAFAAAGRGPEALEIIGQVADQMPESNFSFFQAAIIHTYLKNTEQAFEYLERAYQNRESLIVWAGIEPSLDPLRDDRRYYEFLKKLNHPTLGTIYRERPLLPAAKTAGQTPAPAGPRSIAVLPFNVVETGAGENTGADFLSAGLVDALMTRLAAVRQLLVRPVSPMAAIDPAHLDLAKAGRALNADFLLSGKLVAGGGRIRLSAQLLDTERQTIVWAEKFDQEMGDLLALEDEISARIAASLVPHLTGEERRRLEKRGTEDRRAHELYLRGRVHWNTFTEEGFRQAKFFYERAVELDPSYALAYAGLAEYYLWLGAYAMAAPKDCFPPARAAAEKAVLLDDQSAEAHSALGFARLCDVYDWEGAEQSARRAIELNPHYLNTYIWYASHLFAREKFDEGLRIIDRAVELDPLAFQSHNSRAYGLYFAHRFDEAIRQAEELTNIFPAFSLSYNALANFLRGAGRGAESLAAAERALGLSTALDRMPTLFSYVSSLAAAGKHAEAENRLRQIEREAAGKYLSPREYVGVYRYLGDREKTLAALEKSFADGELLIWLKCDPTLDFIRREPRYRAIVEKINLTDNEPA